MSHLQKEPTFVVWYRNTKGEEKSFATHYDDKETSIKFVKWLANLSDYPNVKEILSVVPYTKTHLYEKRGRVA